MLKELTLKNFVITSNCVISFENGCNVISGETGAGKTMLLQALNLLLGQKGDSKLIRKGEASSYMSAMFQLSEEAEVYTLLENLGVKIKEKEILIERELFSTGKHKILINKQAVTLQVLKSIAPYLVEIISQNSQLMLKNCDMQREALDEYANLTKEKKVYSEAFFQEKALEQKLKELNTSLQEGLLLKSSWLVILRELDDAAIGPNEEEVLFTEYKKIINSHDLSKVGHSLFSRLSEDPSSILHNISSMQRELQKLLQVDPHLETIHSSLAEAYTHLSDASFELGRYLDTLECHPDRLKQIETRLSLIRNFKKRYGEDLFGLQRSLKERIELLESQDIEKEKIKKELAITVKKREKCASILTEKRHQASLVLQKEVSTYLQELNMPGAVFTIQSKKISPMQEGCDLITFYLASNIGEDMAPLAEHASGGELSRTLLALKLSLADKNPSIALIFDEIDANIGGVTASLVGKKLEQLGNHRQVICITHFPQVAAHAHHHIQVTKQMSEGRVIMETKTLLEKEKQDELMRMLGGYPIFNAS